MPSFCAIFNSSNRADREKDKSYYRFPSFVRNNGEEELKLSKLRREKWIAQICGKDLTERKLENIQVCSDHFLTGKVLDMCC